MNVWAVPSALAFVMNLTLCLIVLSSKPPNISHKLFACFVLSFATWNMGEIIMTNSTHLIHAIFGMRVIFVGVIFAPLFFLHFSFFFPFRRQSRWTKGSNFFLFYLIPVGILVTFFLAFQIDQERFRELRSVFYYGLLFKEPLLFLVFLGLAVFCSGFFIYWGIKNLIQSLRATRIPSQKLQIQYLIFGIISMAIAGTIINLLNYFLQLGWPLFFLASLYSILVSLFFAIALIRYRLLDIHLLIRGGILYSIVSGLILAIYVFIIKSIGETISQQAYGRSILIESLLIVGLIFLLQPFQRKVGDWIDHFFYMERVLFRTRLSEFSRALTELVDLEEVTRTTVRFITQTFPVDAVALFLVENGVEVYHPIFADPSSKGMKFSSDHPLVISTKSYGRAVVLEHLKEGGKGVNEIDALIAEGWAVVAPLFPKERLLGFVLLGRKKSEKDYTVEELELLEAFSNQATLAISRALIFRDMTLKDRQILQVEKMAAIGELAAGMAHEIRNPLGIIAGSAETIRKHKNPKIRQEMIDYILEECQRINGLVSTFLDFGRPKESKLVDLDLREILEKTLILLSPKANTLGVEINTELPERPLWVSIDPDQVRQAFMNLGVNALEAMLRGGVLTIQVLESPKGEALIRFSDTGNGIPKEIRAKVFDPFFTTKEGGTGLGLFIVHRVITQHGGNITVENGKERGSIFTIALPLLAK